MSAKSRSGAAAGPEPELAVCAVVPVKCQYPNLGHVAVQPDRRLPVFSVSVGLLEKQVRDRKMSDPSFDDEDAVDLVVRTAQALAINNKPDEWWVYLHNCRVSPDTLFSRLADLVGGDDIADLTDYDSRVDRQSSEQHGAVSYWVSLLCAKLETAGLARLVKYSDIAHSANRTKNLQRIMRYAAKNPNFFGYIAKEATDFLRTKAPIQPPKLAQKFGYFKDNQPKRLDCIVAYAVEVAACLLSSENKASLINSVQALVHAIRLDEELSSQSVSVVFEQLCLPDIGCFYNLLQCIKPKEQPESLFNIYKAATENVDPLDASACLSDHLSVYDGLFQFALKNKSYFSAAAGGAEALTVVDSQLPNLCKALANLRVVCSQLYRLSDIEAPFGIIAAVNNADKIATPVHLKFYYPPLGLWVDSHLPNGSQHPAPMSMAHAAKIFGLRGDSLAQKSVGQATKDRHIEEIIKTPPPLGLISWYAFGLHLLPLGGPANSAFSQVMPLPLTVAEGRAAIQSKPSLSKAAELVDTNSVPLFSAALSDEGEPNERERLFNAAKATLTSIMTLLPANLQPVGDAVGKTLMTILEQLCKDPEPAVLSAKPAAAVASVRVLSRPPSPTAQSQASASSP